MAFFSCKTKSVAVLQQPKASDTIRGIVDSGVEMSESDTVYYQQNSWYSARISIEISTSTTDEISAFLVNRRDSIIYLNINKFGIELARAVLTKDSIVMVNRFEKTFYRGDYSIVKRLYGFSLSFDAIQAIILCEDFSSYTAESSEIKKLDSTFCIRYARRVDPSINSAIQQEICCNSTSKRIVSNSIMDIHTQRVVKINYEAMEELEGFQFPKKYAIILPESLLKIETKSARVNVSGPTSLTIPQKYTPMFPQNGNR